MIPQPSYMYEYPAAIADSPSSIPVKRDNLLALHLRSPIADYIEKKTEPEVDIKPIDISKMITDPGSSKDFGDVIGHAIKSSIDQIRSSRPVIIGVEKIFTSGPYSVYFVIPKLFRNNSDIENIKKQVEELTDLHALASVESFTIKER